MAQTAAHLVERVFPWVPTRQWVVSVPIPLRYWMAASQDLTAKVHTIIRTLRHRGYLEAGSNNAVATGYDPLLDNEPELARTMAASVTQRIAFGERAGQKVRRIGAGFGYEGELPELTGPRCASLGGFSLHANTQIPAHRRDPVGALDSVHGTRRCGARAA
jgi:hypothetical protein